MKHVKMSDLIFLVDLFNISFWYWEEHKLSKGCVLVEKGERTSHGREKGANILVLGAAACGFYEYRLVFPTL